MAHVDADTENIISSRPTVARPYRSHKFPACDFCHRRKSRCDRARQDEPCTLCQSLGKECITNVSERTSTPSRRQTPRRARVATSQRPLESSSPVSGSRADVHDVAFGPDGVETSRPSHVALPIERQSGHIVGPTLARDAQMLDQYISPRDGTAVSHVRPNPYSVYSDDPRDPVVYMKVPRQRSTAPRNGNGTTGFKQCEILEHLLGPHKRAVFDLYFNIVHPPFPILDQAAITKAYEQGALPHTLTCEIYAVSIIFWHLSPSITATKQPPPDVHYIWNLAVSAMHKDFLSPTFSTVLACILDIWGRPITSVTYNAVNIGSTVALAQSLGLNRNPTKWNLDPRQRSLRIKAWWGLLIHDTWASLCHGTPSQIHRDQWDVPLPDLEALIRDIGTNDAERIEKGAHSFVALCRLTNLLCEVLPLMYTIRSRLENVMRQLRRIEASLDDWEDSLPLWLRPSSDHFERDAPGALNLHLCHLSLNICISRIALQETRARDVDVDEALYRQSRCQKAATSLIDFVVSLDRQEIHEFWLPYTAYHLVSATTLMMRCGLEAESDSSARLCIEKAKLLIDYLRRMKQEENWDLAGICLGQCEMTVKQMSESGLAEFRKRNGHTAPWRARGTQRDPADGHAEGQYNSDTLMTDSTMLANGILIPPSGFSMMGDPSDWQTQIPEDFYFPELWQVSHMDT